jgi:uncharacterized Zn-binding protein involved in type VI secretion
MIEYCAGPTFAARYTTKCPECMERIEEGDEARMVDGVAVHNECHDCTCGECE